MKNYIEKLKIIDIFVFINLNTHVQQQNLSTYAIYFIDDNKDVDQSDDSEQGSDD